MPRARPSLQRSARPPRPPFRPREIGSANIWAALLLLLALPIAAISHQPNFTLQLALAAVYLVGSLSSFELYRYDKRQAQTGGWRIPESTLHLTETLGGWPGAFIAQRLLRHKNSKLSYQVTFWLIVLVHQIIALDVLRDGALLQQVFTALQRSLLR